MIKRLHEGPVILVKEDHTYYVEVEGRTRWMPSLSSVLKRAGLSPVYGDDIPEWILKKAAARGDAVHGAVQAVLDGRAVPQLDPAHVEYLNRATELIKVHKLEPLHVETPLFNPVFDYCCTPDFVGYLGYSRQPVVIDWKTTQRVHFQAGFQVAGQALCFREAEGFDLYVGDLKTGVLRPFRSERYMPVVKTALWVKGEVDDIEEEETA